MKLTILALLVSPLAHAAVLAQWTFETTPPTGEGPYTADVGSGTARRNYGVDLPVFSNPAGNGSMESFSSTQWKLNDSYQFTVSTTGASGLSISFDQGSTGTGPRNFEIFYSTGGAFISTGNTYLVHEYGTTGFPMWSSTVSSSAFTYTFDLSSITALNNQATVQIRLQMIGNTSADNGAIGGGGVSRIDNFTVNALTAVPEPATAILLSISMIGLFLRRR